MKNSRGVKHKMLCVYFRSYSCKNFSFIISELSYKQGIFTALQILSFSRRGMTQEINNSD